MPNPSSRRRYREYRQELIERRNDKKSTDADRSDKKNRQRTFWQLLSAFWRQLGNHRRSVIFALATLTVSTILGLLPPAGTKFAIDYVLTKPPQPLPSWLSRMSQG